jgi:hypothetical protein
LTPQPLTGSVGDPVLCWLLIVSHFSELDADLEVLGSRHSTRLIEDEVDTLWSWVRAVADLLVSHVPSSIAHNTPDSAGE